MKNFLKQDGVIAPFIMQNMSKILKVKWLLILLMFLFVSSVEAKRNVEVMQQEKVDLEHEQMIDEWEEEGIFQDSIHFSCDTFTMLSFMKDFQSVKAGFPADSLFRIQWDSLKINPYNVCIDSLPDSFRVNCRPFVAPNTNVITSEFGERWGRFHAGIDSRVVIGDTIRAVFDGKVRITRVGMRKKGYGYFVLVRHNNGFETLYAHLSKVLVTPNQDVKAGEAIGLGGNTGRSTGPHLHFEIRFLGNPINPRKIVNFDTNELIADTFIVDKKSSFKEYIDFINSPIKYHRIKSGDTLGGIARRYRTTVSRLCRLNGIKSTTILRIGRRLRVY